VNENLIAAALGGFFGLVLTILIGLVIGAVAKLLIPGKDPGGWFATSLLGIGGSLLGRVGLSLLGIQGDWIGLVAAIAGAMLLLLVFRQFRKA